MSRPLRIQYPGAWYHVMNRGLNRRRIFYEDGHREQFFALLNDIHIRYGVQTHAYISPPRTLNVKIKPLLPL